MDVKCTQCNTEYEFDDAKVTEAGVKVKCANCGYLFRVKRSSMVVTEPLEGGGPDSVGASGPWLIRLRDGNVYTFDGLTTLQRWILEQRVCPDDEISKSGEAWARLGGIAELASSFQAAEAQPVPAWGMSPPASPFGMAYPGQSPLVPGGPVMGLTPQSPRQEDMATFPVPSPPAVEPFATVPVGPPSGMRAPQPARAEEEVEELEASEIMEEPKAARPRPEAKRVVLPEPRPEAKAEPVVAREEIRDEWEEEEGGRGRGKLIGLIAGGVVVLLVVVAMVIPSVRKAIFGSISEEAVALVQASVEEMAPDRVEAYERAMKGAEEALALEPEYALAHVALSEAASGAARINRYLYERGERGINAINQELEDIKAKKVVFEEAIKEADSDERAAPHKAALEELKAKEKARAREGQRLGREIGPLESAARRYLEQSFAHATKASELEGELVEAHRALAKYYVLQGEKSKADDLVEKVLKAHPQDKEALILSATMRIDDPLGIKDALTTLDGVLEQKSDAVKALFYRGLIHKRMERKDKAMADLGRVVELSPGHELAKVELVGLEPPKEAVAVAAVTAPQEAKDPPKREDPPKKEPAKEEEKKDKKPAPAERPKEREPRVVEKAPEKEKAKEEDKTPRNIRGVLSQADNALKRGKVSQAFDLFEKAATMNTSHPAPMAGMGWCAMEKSKPSEAVGYFKLALAKQASHGDSLIGMAEAYKAMGQKGHAIKFYQKYIQYHPSGPQATLANNALSSLQSQ